jgi:hypothetical protein
MSGAREVEERLGLSVEDHVQRVRLHPFGIAGRPMSDNAAEGQGAKRSLGGGGSVAWAPGFTQRVRDRALRIHPGSPTFPF